MRYFSSYGPIDKEQHYFVPRKELLSKAYTYLMGEIPEKGGHYITVWAPRQSGKSSLLIDLYRNIFQDENYLSAYISIQNLKGIDNSADCLNAIAGYISRVTKIQLPEVKSTLEFQEVFSADHLPKPLILIIDEFDSLQENVINDLVGVFRNIYHTRMTDNAVFSGMQYLLHGVALIGVRSVVGVENKSGSPFNVQRSLQVLNLTEAEVNEMYHWYEEETGQIVEQEVIDRIFYVTQGQPGLVSWFGELLTNTYNNEPDRPLTMKHFADTYTMALRGLPNNTVINIISKVKAEPYRQKVLELFRTNRKTEFRFEKKEISYLYMNGVISYEKSEGLLYVKFPCQFIQEKLFDHFTDEMVKHGSQLLADPYMDLTPVINEEGINICRLLELYQEYYTLNKDRLTEYAQRRVDMQIMEVVYHFQLYSWLDSFLRGFGTVVLPEFPTGNGKIDLLIRHRSKLYGLELKSFTQLYLLNKSIKQASEYGQGLGLAEITLIVFIDRPMPAEISIQYTEPHVFTDGAAVNIFFLQTS